MIKKNLLIIVPARGGSTGLKNKNIKKLGGKPLLYYSLKAGENIDEKSKELICSTDSKKIKKIVEKMKYKVPFLRPKNISGKYASDVTFINHSLKFYFKKKIKFKNGVILRPTAPFRKKRIINNAYRIFKNSNYSSMRAIINSPITPYRMWKKKVNTITPIFNSGLYEQFNIPRQKLPRTYFQAGNFEFFKVNYKSFIKSVSGNKIYGYLIDGFLSADVDSAEDLIIANKLFKKNNGFIK